ncbi:MAG: thioredoxin-like domain-containing protein, partial [Tenuifilaceae bacterium]|nr:thioredoxin-like domain-containing protein [Tenuifilaceae bacterium]
MRRIIFIAIAIAALISETNAQGYRIEVKIDGLADTKLQLGYYHGEKTLLADTATTNSKGVAVFKGDTLLPRGMYFVVLPENFFELILEDNQQFGITTSIDNVNQNLKFTNSPENTAFDRYRKFLAEKQNRMGELQKQAQEQREATGEVDKGLVAKIEALDSDVKTMWDETVAANQGSMLAAIINTLKPVEFPDFGIPDDAPNADSLRWITSIRYNQKHYFDNVDFSESGLIRTPFFVGRIDNYFDRVLIPVADTIVPYADRIIERARANDDMYRFIVTHLFSKFSNSSIMGMDAVFVHIAEKYFLSGQTPWITEETKGKIAERVGDLKPNLIGQIAPNFRMASLSGGVQELHKVNAEVTVVYFWEPSCSHCKRVTPLLRDLYNKFKDKGMAVVAVYTQGEMDKWKEYVDSNELKWINVWDPTRGSRYHKLYDIYSTPVLYILDKDKRIVAKRIGIESLERFIEQEIL